MTERDLEAQEHVRYLAEKVTHATRLRLMRPDEVDSLLLAITAYIRGPGQRRDLADAALAAVAGHTAMMKAVLEELTARAAEVWLTLPGPAGKVIPGHGRGPKDRALPRQARARTAPGR